MEPLNYNSTVQDLPKSNIRFNLENWKVRIHSRRGGKNMRLTINLDKDQATAFANFKKVCKPDEVSDDNFIKTIFLTGVESMNNQLQEVLKKYVRENKEQLAASGISVIEGDDGEIQLSEISQGPDQKMIWYV